MSPAIFLRSPVCGLALLALASCSSGPLGYGGGSGGAVGPSGTAAETRADRETLAACRQRANEMYDLRDRAQIYAANSGINSPNSGAYLGGIPNRGLSEQFDYERTIADCTRYGTGADANVAPAPAPPPPAPKSR